MDQQAMDIPIWDLVSPERAKEIAEEELRLAFRQQIKTESDIERVLANLTMEYVFTLVAEQWDGDFSERLRKEISKAIEHDNVRYEVFRRKDAWGRTESPAVAILDEECRNSRPLIKAAVERHIAEYPFHELDREEIAETIWQVIMEKIMNPKKEESS